MNIGLKCSVVYEICSENRKLRTRNLEVKEKTN